MTEQSNALLASLPPELAERVRPMRSKSVTTDGEFVLYWMRTAVRTRENPALNVAIAAANQRNYFALPPVSQTRLAARR